MLQPDLRIPAESVKSDALSSASTSSRVSGSTGACWNLGAGTRRIGFGRANSYTAQVKKEESVI